jgi:uncharacterized protein YjbI with pentapeptide repeats
MNEVTLRDQIAERTAAWRAWRDAEPRIRPDEEHLAVLRAGVDAWRAWRARNPQLRPNLRGADLAHWDLRGARFSDADLKGVNLIGADLRGARFGDTYLRRGALVGANLEGANLSGANLRHADLTGARLARASLRRADVTKADLTRADVSGAVLDYARLVETRLEDATLSGCSVYGVAAWNLDLRATTQTGLRISRPTEPTITVDNLEIAQFVYLLLNNAKLRSAIDTIGNKAVLILGRFTAERKAVLDAIRVALRFRDLVPIIFDFDPPQSRDLFETVRTLAHLSRFIVADLTDPRSIPGELAGIVPMLPSVPVQPVIHESQDPWAMFPSLRSYDWVLEPYRYASAESLIAALDARVLAPAEEAVQRRRANGVFPSP